MPSIFVALTSFMSGVITWSFMEYALHSQLGHKKGKKNPFTKEHLKHHRDTDYFASTSKKLMAAGLVFAATTLIFGLITTWLIGVSFAIGFSLMYIAYEVVHRRAHTHGPTGKYSRWVRKHHFHHHFKNPKVNHGVTSSVWDVVFGTLEKPEVVMVPRKLALPWLIDPDTREILPQYTHDYQLRGGATAKL